LLLLEKEGQFCVFQSSKFCNNTLNLIFTEEEGRKNNNEAARFAYNKEGGSAAQAGARD
jgi:hypothetical protein